MPTVTERNTNFFIGNYFISYSGSLHSKNNKLHSNNKIIFYN